MLRLMIDPYTTPQVRHTHNLGSASREMTQTLALAAARCARNEARLRLHFRCEFARYHLLHWEPEVAPRTSFLHLLPVDRSQ
jgi:hypothetical protein